MSAAAQVDYTYRYPMPSFVGRARGEFGLFLATCDAAQQSPYFFSGLMRQPGSTAKMLLALSSVVRSHFYVPLNSLMLDPVVTCNEQMIRFEGFSGCCGVYARVDLESDAFDADLRLRGTTNVDFNDPMRASLAGLRDGDEARLAVGTEGVTLETGEETVFEKKVALPARWIKGFNEVQCYQRALQLRFAVAERWMATTASSKRDLLCPKGQADE